MPKTIIWASDGSDNAARALPHAKALLEGEGAMLIAVHVAQERSSLAPDPETVDRDEPGLVDEIRGVVGDITDRGIRAALRVVNFPGMQPAQCIADIASEVEADMIVVGTRGHSPIGGVFAGSVTQRLLEIAPCPVLAVPPRAAPPQPSATPPSATEAGVDVPV